MVSNKGSSSTKVHQRPKPSLSKPTRAPSSRYESQKRRDWGTFCQYLLNSNPSVALTEYGSTHVLDFLRYLDQFGKTKVHMHGCVFFGKSEGRASCACPLRQAWGSLDSMIGRLRAAFEEDGGLPELNPFASGDVKMYLRDVRDLQSIARGVLYKKKKKKKPTTSQMLAVASSLPPF